MPLKFLISHFSVSLLLAFGVVGSPADAKWLRAESRHFIAYADTSEENLREDLRRLEIFDSMMRRLFAIEDTVKVRLFILPSLSEVQNLAGDRNIGGFYNASAQLAYAFVPERLANYQEGYTAENVLLHEYAHHMLLGGTDRYVPAWATEGLATMFMTARYDSDGGITIGAPNPAFSQAMYGASRWTVKQLLRSDTEKVSRNERVELYSRGWVLSHYLWLSGERPGQYIKFIDILNRTGDALTAGRQAFGDLDGLDRELNAYLRRSGFPASRFTPEQLDAPTQINIRPLTPGEEAILPSRMVSLLGVDKERSLELLAEARPAAAPFPKDPFVQRSMTEIEYDAASLNGMSFDQAGAAADRTLSSDPDNVMALAYKGRIAIERALEGDKSQWATARDLLLEANKANPNNPLPFMLYYDSFVAQGVTPPDGAVGGLYRAIVLMPQDLSLRARGAVELIRGDEIKRAREVLAPAAFNPHAPQENPMRDLIEQIDAGKSSEALMAWIDGRDFAKRYNDFLGREIAEKDAKKDESEE